MRKTARVLMGLACCWALAATSHAQDIEPKYKTADTNNAVIQGRVTLPSGFAAERYFRLTLRNVQGVLIANTYTNQSGEFQIRNLSEGTYYVQAETTDGSFDPAATTVALGRGIVAELVLELREKGIPRGERIKNRVVSAAELRQVVPGPAKKEYKLGVKFVGKGNYGQAAAHFEQAVTLYPEYLAARNDLGAQYLKLKRLDEAEKSFQMVLARDPKNFNAKFNLGLVRVERKDYLDAINQLNEAIVIDSTRPVARLWLGVALLEMGDLTRAEQELTKALIMGGDECVASNYHLARIYLARGDTAEAARSVEIYLEEAPKGEYVDDARRLREKLQVGAKP